MQKRAYLHSPFCEATVGEPNRFILLQFILKELFLSHSLCKDLNPKVLLTKETLIPFSLSSLTQSAPLDRIQEHSALLPFAFPNQKEELAIFSHSLSNTVNLVYNFSRFSPLPKTYPLEVSSYLRQMFLLLEPFLRECKNEGAFLFFLLSHYKEISLLSHSKHLLSLLKKFHSKGMGFVQEKICDHFYKKGFTYLIPEVKSLVKEFKKDTAS